MTLACEANYLQPYWPDRFGRELAYTKDLEKGSIVVLFAVCDGLNPAYFGGSPRPSGHSLMAGTGKKILLSCPVGEEIWFYHHERAYFELKVTVSQPYVPCTTCMYVSSSNSPAVCLRSDVGALRRSGGIRLQQAHREEDRNPLRPIPHRPPPYAVSTGSQYEQWRRSL